jgi:hypothetical protein
VGLNRSVVGLFWLSLSCFVCAVCFALSCTDDSAHYADSHSSQHLLRSDEHLAEQVVRWHAKSLIWTATHNCHHYSWSNSFDCVIVPSYCCNAANDAMTEDHRHSKRVVSAKPDHRHSKSAVSAKPDDHRHSKSVVSANIIVP